MKSLVAAKFNVLFSSVFLLTIFFTASFTLAVLGVCSKVIEGIYSNDVKHLLSHHARFSVL